MKSYYKKAFETVSIFFFIALVLIVWLGFSFRVGVPDPTSISSIHSAYISKFGLPVMFFAGNMDIFAGLLFIISLATIISIYLLGKETIGKMGGLVAALFFAVYPYFVSNVYSPSTTYLFFFIIFLLFNFYAFRTMFKRYAFVSGIFFTVSILLEPSLLIISLIPILYFIIKLHHKATLKILLFFFIGVCLSLGVFVLLSLLTSTLPSLLPNFTAFSEFGNHVKAFIAGPLKYITNIIWPYLTANFSHPLVAGTHSYLHYVILTLAVLGALYSFINENIRAFSILIIFMLLQVFFMPSFPYIIILTMLLLLAGYMIDKVIGDVFKV